MRAQSGRTGGLEEKERGKGDGAEGVEWHAQKKKKKLIKQVTSNYQANDSSETNQKM